MSINLKKTIRGTIIKINDQMFSNVKNISINKSRIIINGQDVTPNDKVINITIEGEVPKLDIDVCNKIDITGNVGSVKTMSGDIEITGNITGDVQSMSGDISCQGNLEGDAQSTSGDINVKGSIAGNVKTVSGDIKSK